MTTFRAAVLERVPAEADSNLQAPVSKSENGDEILIRPMELKRLAGENPTVQAQSTNLSTAFVDNTRGPDFARRKLTFCKL
jgi:hypothetical protein